MPADHLNTSPTPAPAVFVTPVLAVLAGADPQAIAAQHDLNPGDLDDAARVYQAAGLAALERQHENSWYQVRIQFADWSATEAIATTALKPALNRLRADRSVAGWWFLRKYPCWRLRLSHADTAAVDHVLDELVCAGAIERWWSTVYEPETAAFGGTIGMDTVHDLFCADSAGALDYLCQDSPGLGRRELSILLLNGLMRAAGLDTFECGDVFDRVAQMRPAPADTDTVRIGNLVDNVRVLLSIPNLTDSDLFTSGGPVAHAAPWLAALRSAGQQLGHDAGKGLLDRGLRAILTHVAIFHWNRFGLSATSQGILARAAATALLPRS
ncbi:thiopeptide-type bacteriocin biosynthesis protein [Lentzea sp. E54]|uniref:thiopeptide-type bacteriocin biosynthesis protein n=1 Tax=Lentzea xerophila TaxID=3435883 RepID=UPI003DA4FB0E